MPEFFREQDEPEHEHGAERHEPLTPEQAVESNADTMEQNRKDGYNNPNGFTAPAEKGEA